MIIVNAQNVYSFILTEDEWYSATEQQQQAWVTQCLREAEQAKQKYATIMVDPDAVMSVSPKSHRHKVWGHTFDVVDELAFTGAIVDVCIAYEKRLTKQQIVRLLKHVLKHNYGVAV